MLPYARQPPRHRWIVPRRVSPANLLICSSMMAPEDRSLACGGSERMRVRQDDLDG